ncbi:hypothetical protein Aperf_G00000105542 [Anoplocephala perfoliata]
MDDVDLSPRRISFFHLQRIASNFPMHPIHRPDCGRLPNGEYFASEDEQKEYYLLFSNVTAYIVHCLQVIFSDENISREAALRARLAFAGGVDLQDLLTFPCLADAQVQQNELLDALPLLPHLQIQHVEIISRVDHDTAVVDLLHEFGYGFFSAESFSD